VRGIVRHPDLELVGLHAHAKEKQGVDAAELCGLPQPTGVRATNDVDALLALDADCVCYTAQGETRIRETIGDLCRILESGKNVVNTAIVSLVYPPFSSPKLRERLEQACAKGRTTFLTTGFDPGARRNAWEIVSNLSSIGKTVFLTTHYMDEAQHLANRVAVIAHGTIVAEGPPGSLAGRDRMRTSIRFRLPPGAPEPDRTAHRLPDGGYELRADQEETTKLVHDLTAWALESGFVLDALEVTPPTLEDVYLELTGEEAAE